MSKAKELLAKHWTKATGKPLDDLTATHLQYSIDAINEALGLNNNVEKIDKLIVSYQKNKSFHSEHFKVDRANLIDGKLTVFTHIR